MIVEDTGTVTAEPISMAEARLHLKLDATGSPATHPDDNTVVALITAVRQHVEQRLGRNVAPREMTVTYDAWADEMSLPYGPVHSVTSVKYDAPAATSPPWTETTLAATEYNLVGGLGSCLEMLGDRPALAAKRGSIRIAYQAGYTNGGSPDPYPLPGPIKAAMLLLLGHLFENREAVNIGTMVVEMPFAVDALLAPYRPESGP